MKKDKNNNKKIVFLFMISRERLGDNLPNRNQEIRFIIIYKHNSYYQWKIYNANIWVYNDYFINNALHNVIRYCRHKKKENKKLMLSLFIAYIF